MRDVNASTFKIYQGSHLRSELPLSLLHCIAYPSQIVRFRQGFLDSFFIIFLCHNCRHITNKFVVEVLTSHMHVSIDCLYCESTVRICCEHCYIKGATTEIKNHNILVRCKSLLRTIRNGCCSRLIDNFQDLKFSLVCCF